ncbi:unnamed protein product [Brachionus calyciflorus]|uniref:Uncharacterized protein n=1 Tax=Brachionus calyciflorus TaxID=104777 RepID=A0A813NMH9_9BILA|nr:unnamed protein product [Brachionus calyciflorus]
MDSVGVNNIYLKEQVEIKEKKLDDVNFLKFVFNKSSTGIKKTKLPKIHHNYSLDFQLVSDLTTSSILKPNKFVYKLNDPNSNEYMNQSIKVPMIFNNESPLNQANKTKKNFLNATICSDLMNEYKNEISHPKDLSPDRNSTLLSDDTIDSNNIKNEIEDCKNYILNQKELLKKIHQQQKSLKTYRRNNSLGCLNSKTFTSGVQLTKSHDFPKFKKPQSEIHKAKAKKDNLETEIEYLENHLRINKKVYDVYPMENAAHDFEIMNRKNPIGLSHEEFLKLSNERDYFRQKLHFEIGHRETQIRELQNQLNQARDDLGIENKIARDKVARLEEELKIASNRFEEMTIEKDEFAIKVKSLENRLSSLQYELVRRDKESYSKDLAENTEKHLTNLCQTLTSQLDDMRFNLKTAEEKLRRLENDHATKDEKMNSLTNQIENSKKELEQSLESYQKMKRTYEEQLNSHLIREKKQDDEIRNLQETLKSKQAQFDSYQREFELSIGPKFDERIKKEKFQWEQEQNFLIKRELSKVNEEKLREMTRIQDELTAEREKYIQEREKALKFEKQIEELNQEVKFANKEKSLAVNKAKESLKAETEKLKNGLLNEKQEEINRLKKILNDLEEEINRLKVEQYQNVEKDKEFILNVEKLEKTLIKDINEELRKLSALIPGIMPKIVNYSNLRSSYSVKNVDNAMTLNTFQLAFSNLRSLLDEVTQNYQNIKIENEQTKRVNARLMQEKDEEIEIAKRQFEKQKQKELESIREFINKDQETTNSYTTEINNLVNALKNKDKEIKEIQENMSGWKKETLSKLAEKFEVELNRELDKRMKEYKEESANQQNQLDKLRKEIDCLIKECRQTSANQISQEQHERMTRYLQSRLNDLRDENLVLRDRFKVTNYLQANQVQNSFVPCFNENEYNNRTNLIYNQSMNQLNQQVKNSFVPDDENVASSVYSSSIDADDNLESRNEILQQKLKELQKLQIQLNNVQS